MASLVLHGLLAVALLRAPPAPPAAEEPLAIELVEAPLPAPAPAAPAAVARANPGPADPGPARAPHVPPASPAGRAPRALAPEPPPPGPAPPPPPPPNDGPAWMKLRSPAQALQRGAAPVDPAALAGPVRDALGLPYTPPPNVIHHPIASGPSSQGRHQAESGVTAKIAGDGAISFKDPDAVEDMHWGGGPMGVRVTGKFDLNDTVLRAIGDDPYAYAKKKYAEATFEDRLCLAEKAAMARKQDALFQLKDRLEALRRNPGLSGAQRREMVFELWDECLDESKSKDGPDLGAVARATIFAFIRRAFPPDGPEAYALNELAALNRRRASRAPFDPYGTLSARPDAGAGLK